jgi:peptidoglycan hydrolase-like protein with peptidoglycan-binding domain
MHRSITTTSRVRRHALSALAFGVVLSLSPVFPGSGPLSAQAPATATTGLARGAQGDAVRSVQQALVNQGIQVAGGVDGVFGAGTEAALKQFQSEHGLSASGVVDAPTALELGLASSPVLGLTQGVRSEQVLLLQQQLIAAGISVSGGADGIFGPGTAAAVKQFQTDQGFVATGTVDASTAAALAAFAPTPAPAAETPAAETPAAETPTPTPAATPTGDANALVGLKTGSRGTAVQTLQQRIIDAGFTVVGGADGIFGVLTGNALRSFQNANGLAVTGVVDDATAAALANVVTPTPGADTHDPTVTASPLLGLKYGSIGSDVKALQQALIAAGITVRGGADGVFGPATTAALKSYQAGHGLEQTGQVDEATANALASVGGTTVAGSPLLGLKSGALGNTVKQLQQALIDAGVKVRGGADGIFGPATTNALKEFQTSQGISASGVVDETTIAALADPQAASSPTTTSPSTTQADGYAAYGEKGARVMALQTALTAAGITVRGGVDGDFGAGTSAAVMEFQTRQGLSVTGKVDDATATALGLAAGSAPAEVDPLTVQIPVFPVQGTCTFGDSFGFPRGGGRTHLGVDIIAAAGNLLYSAIDGTITKVYADYPGSLAGNGLRITMADGTYVFYAHMTGIADGIDVGVPVKAGQIVGTVGSTGNSGTPHLHFEVHPLGGAAVNPYPIVKAIDGCGNTTPLPQP